MEVPELFVMRLATAAKVGLMVSMKLILVGPGGGESEVGEFDLISERECGDAEAPVKMRAVERSADVEE